MRRRRQSAAAGAVGRPVTPIPRREPRQAPARRGQPPRCAAPPAAHRAPARRRQRPALRRPGRPIRLFSLAVAGQAAVADRSDRSGRGAGQGGTRRESLMAARATSTAGGDRGTSFQLGKHREGPRGPPLLAAILALHPACPGEEPAWRSWCPCLIRVFRRATLLQVSVG